MSLYKSLTIRASIMHTMFELVPLKLLLTNHLEVISAFCYLLISFIPCYVDPAWTRNSERVTDASPLRPLGWD